VFVSGVGVQFFSPDAVFIPSVFDDTETIAGYVATLHRLVTKGFTPT